MDALEDLFEPSPPGEGGGGEERMGLAWVNEGGWRGVRKGHYNSQGNHDNEHGTSSSQNTQYIYIVLDYNVCIYHD